MNRKRLEKIILLAREGVIYATSDQESLAFRKVYFDTQRLYVKKTGHCYRRLHYEDDEKRQIQNDSTALVGRGNPIKLEQ